MAIKSLRRKAGKRDGCRKARHRPPPMFGANVSSVALSFIAGPKRPRLAPPCVGAWTNSASRRTPWNS